MLLAATTNTGGVYDPATDTWTATSTTGAPSGRLYHTAVWTGSKMIVWGGHDGAVANTGGVYDPATNTWTAATSTTLAPPARRSHTAVWTGSTMIVWGGTGSANDPQNSGGVYDPATPEQHALTASRDGNGSGTVTSSPAGIDCGTDCTEDYNHGTSVTLTPSAAIGSTFTAWAGACADGGACVVTIDAATSVTATFTLNQYALTVSRDGTGSGTVGSSPSGIDCGADCTEGYSHGTSVTLTRSAATGSTFTAWSGACTGSGACVVTMDAAKSVTATFTLKQYALTVNHDGTGSGTVTSSPSGIDCGFDCTESYDHGTLVTLMATAAADSSFTSWGGGCTGSGACVVTMDAARSVTATFTVNEHTLTVSRDGAGSGAVTSSPSGIDCGTDCTEDYADATEVTLTPVAAIGSSFAGWSGACAGADACVVTMDAAQSATATFTLNDHGGTDFNGDGKPDVLWRNQQTDDLYVWFMDGTTRVGGSYLTPSRFPEPNWQVRGVADFNSDGKVDLLWHNQETGDLYVWLMDGTVVTAGAALSPSPFADAHWRIGGVADFNGDGKPDALWHNQATGDLYAWFLDGTVPTTGTYLTPTHLDDPRWQIRGVADFNGDGKPDVLWHHQLTGELLVWSLDGTVRVSADPLTSSELADTHWQIRQVADFDRDGRMDLLWHNRANGDLHVWLLDVTVTTEESSVTPSRSTDVRWQIVPDDGRSVGPSTRSRH